MLFDPSLYRLHHSLCRCLTTCVDIAVSSPGESHPEALSEPYLNLSAHTAPAMEPRRSPICQGRSAAIAAVGQRKNLQRKNLQLAPSARGCYHDRDVPSTRRGQRRRLIAAAFKGKSCIPTVWLNRKVPICCNTPTTPWIGIPGAKKLSKRRAPTTSPSSFPSPSATPPATGATSWSAKASRTRRSPH